MKKNVSGHWFLLTIFFCYVDIIRKYIITKIMWINFVLRKLVLFSYRVPQRIMTHLWINEIKKENFTLISYLPHFSPFLLFLNLGLFSLSFLKNPSVLFLSKVTWERLLFILLSWKGMISWNSLLFCSLQKTQSFLFLQLPHLWTWLSDITFNFWS